MSGGLGRFFGIGVGPGPAGMIPLAAFSALQQADLILVPRAKHVDRSIAKQCLNGLGLPESKFKEIIYNMDPDRAEVEEHYRRLAEDIVRDLKDGRTVAYLTIGDSLTYSTYGYLVGALLRALPDLEHKTFPGITSYCALAAAFDWPLGQGKETTLILPCPDDMAVLRRQIETHDVVVLMKIGKRLNDVLGLLKHIGVIGNCVFASRLGLPGEVRSNNLVEFEPDDSIGYLSTILIRRDGKGLRRGAAILSDRVAELPVEEVSIGVP
ncbi:MAG: precorrin-2 C(20)-methyltransferase [Candidatus Melainabacteria bacterium]|nr:MAG: precorrin-2 C(20)-methyltransferase [Candidatus Melainabacteria bacterium]